MSRSPLGSPRECSAHGPCCAPVTRRVDDVNTGRSSRPFEDEELRLPRTPGVIRRFWARHPILADVLIALACFVMSAAPVTVFSTNAAPLAVSEAGDPIPVVFAVIIVAAVAITCVLLLRRRQWPRIVFTAGW